MLKFQFIPGDAQAQKIIKSFINNRLVAMMEEIIMDEAGWNMAMDGTLSDVPKDAGFDDLVDIDKLADDMGFAENVSICFWDTDFMFLDKYSEDDLIHSLVGEFMGLEEHWTLEECGKESGVSRERIRQILERAINRLQHPSKTMYIREGYHACSERIEKERTQAQAERTAMLDEQKMKQLEGIHIADVGFTTRSYNCTRRAGLETMADVARKVYEGNNTICRCEDGTHSLNFLSI